MPTYEYRCKECGHDFETVQSFTDDALTTCPECEGPLKKVYGNVGISFKGSGFYKNDARSGGSGTSASSSKDAAASSDGAASDSASSDTSETKKSETTTSETKKSETTSSETKKSETRSTSSDSSNSSS